MWYFIHWFNNNNLVGTNFLTEQIIKCLWNNFPSLMKSWWCLNYYVLYFPPTGGHTKLTFYWSHFLNGLPCLTPVEEHGNICHGCVFIMIYGCQHCTIYKWIFWQGRGDKIRMDLYMMRSNTLITDELSLMS